MYRLEVYIRKGGELATNRFQKTEFFVSVFFGFSKYFDSFLSILTWYQKQVTRLPVFHEFFSLSRELSCGFFILGIVSIDFWSS
jgi:hypothetical protein